MTPRCVCALLLYPSLLRHCSDTQCSRAEQTHDAQETVRPYRFLTGYDEHESGEGMKSTWRERAEKESITVSVGLGCGAILLNSTAAPIAFAPTFPFSMLGNNSLLAEFFSLPPSHGVNRTATDVARSALASRVESALELKVGAQVRAGLSCAVGAPVMAGSTRPVAPQTRKLTIAAAFVANASQCRLKRGGCHDTLYCSHITSSHLSIISLSPFVCAHCRVWPFFLGVFASRR